MLKGPFNCWIYLQVSIGSDNGLVPTGRQAISWTNMFSEAYMRHLALMYCGLLMPYCARDPLTV